MVITSLVEVRTGIVVVGAVLIRYLLVIMDETLEVGDTLDTEDTAEVWTKLEAEDFVEL